MREERAMRISYIDFVLLRSKAQGKRCRLSLVALAIFFLPLESVLPAAAVIPVWIDTDASIGLPFREVDDGFALLLALKCPNLRIVGISTTYGNASLKRTTAVTKELISRFHYRFGDQIPKVSPGAQSGRDLGIETAATKALAEAVRENANLVYLAF